MVGAERHREDFRQNFFGTIITLVVQFMLGMAVNLFVVIPKNHPGANPPEYFSGVAQSVTWAILHGPLWLILHAVLGLLLVLFAARLVVSAVLARERSLIIVSVTGGLAVLAAGFNGGSYLNYHEDISSMLMSTFFAIAIVTYAIGLWLPPRRQEGRA